MRIIWGAIALLIASSALAEPAIDIDLLTKMRGSGDQDYSLFVEMGSLSGVLEYCGLPQQVQKLSHLSVPMIDRFIETHQLVDETPERTRLINTSHASYIMGIADGASDARREFYENADLSSEARKKICDRAQTALTTMNGAK